MYKYEKLIITNIVIIINSPSVIPTFQQKKKIVYKLVGQIGRLVCVAIGIFSFVDFNHKVSALLNAIHICINFIQYISLNETLDKGLLEMQIVDGRKLGS